MNDKKNATFRVRKCDQLTDGFLTIIIRYMLILAFSVRENKRFSNKKNNIKKHRNLLNLLNHPYRILYIFIL